MCQSNESNVIQDNNRKILLNTISKVKKFANISNKSSINIDIRSGKYLIDGKSIMGIFSLDLSKELTISSDSSKEEFNAYCEQIQEFLVD